MANSVTVVSGPGGARSASRWRALSLRQRSFGDPHAWLAAAIYAAIIVYCDRQSVAHLSAVCGCSPSADPTQWMWTWDWFPYAIGHGLNPFYTHVMWAPQGLDLASTTLSPVVAIPGVPLTALFGPTAAYSLITLATPVLNGWAAYRLCRYVSGAPWASILAGYFYGFSAYTLGEMLGHLNLMLVFVPPLVALAVLKCINGDASRLRTGAVLSLLLLIEFGISTEVFFTMTATGLVGLVAGWIFGTRQVRRAIVATVPLILIAYVLTGGIWSYYIVKAFSVPSFSKGTGAYYPGDLLSWFFPTPVFRIGANRFTALSATFNTSNASEQGNYLGLGLWLIVIGFTITTWRRRGTKVLFVTTAVAAVFSLGTVLTIGGQGTFSMPFSWVQHWPLFDLILPTRIGNYVALGAALMAAIWIGEARGGARIWRWLLGALAVVCLVPNLGYGPRLGGFYSPQFFTRPALYKRFVPHNSTVLPIPFAYASGSLSLLWQADTHFWFRMVGGYLGQTPPTYSSIPIDAQLMAGTPGANAVADMRSFVISHDVTRVLIVEGSTPSPWSGVLRASGWELTASAGGVAVYRPTPALLSQISRR